MRQDQCPGCKVQFKDNPKYYDKKVKCPKCGTTFVYLSEVHPVPAPTPTLEKKLAQKIVAQPVQIVKPQSIHHQFQEEEIPPSPITVTWKYLKYFFNVSILYINQLAEYLGNSAIRVWHYANTKPEQEIVQAVAITKTKKHKFKARYYHTKIAGIYYRNLSLNDLIKLVKVGDRLMFQAEPDNRVDKNAVKIFTGNYTWLGYLSKYVAKNFEKDKQNGDVEPFIFVRQINVHETGIDIVVVLVQKPYSLEDLDAYIKYEIDWGVNIEPNQSSTVIIQNAQWNPGVAAVLSFLLPGLGQIYKGQIINGLAWFCLTALGYICCIVPGLVIHFCCILGAASGNSK